MTSTIAQAAAHSGSTSSHAHQAIDTQYRRPRAPGHDIPNLT